ncbi:MAG TPA: HAMP domain-containing protein, partial [Anaeromyxobacteraceae bacterium]|nr:HAMP domain-containing protein [Anaeromyxobacteraceae bacterium]
MRRVAAKIVLTFAVALLAFGLVAALAVARLHALGQDLRLLSAGYFPLGRIAAQLEVKDWVASRALEARDLDPAARRAYLPVARAHFPALVKEKLEEGRRVARDAARLGGDEDAKVLGEVEARLDALGLRWAEYDRAARALLDGLERAAPPAELEGRAQEVRQLEKGLSVEVKLLQAQLESRIADRVHAAERAESRTVALIVIYSAIALLVGLGAALVARRLLAPIERLTEGVKAVAAGDLTRQVEVPGRDEIGQLAREFNAMAASLDAQRRELRRAERLAAVGRISAQITHEVRNPLNAIGLNAELLAEELEARPDLSPEARSLCAAISREVDRLNAVTEEYLRFARPPRQAAGRLDLAEAAGNLLDFLAPELSAAKVEVRRELPAGLPAVRGEEGPLRAVLLNLVRNSREAMAGGGVLAVTARRAPGGEAAVELAVSDTGGGIPPEALSRIFDPFYSTKERGTGLGL